MNIKNLFFLPIILLFAACSHNHGVNVHDEPHENEKIQYTIYTDDFELFAESDPLILGDTAHILAHFTALPGFKAMEKGRITLSLSVNGNVVSTTLDKPTRKGIYSFVIIPYSSGKGTLKFVISTENGNYDVVIPEVVVYASDEEHEDSEEHKNDKMPESGLSVFTKEQSWKIDFATELPVQGPIGQTIKTTALVLSSPQNEVMVTSKMRGIVKYAIGNLLEGKEISSGKILFTVSGQELADNDFPVRFSESNNNYEKAKADYDRIADLAKDKIVSEKELLRAKNQLDNAKAVYENLRGNYNVSGQKIRSPLSGYVKQIFVQNGEFVEAGQAIVAISQNKTMVLKAEVAQKYASMLNSVKTANIYSMQNKKTYTLDDLNGRILSYGKSTNHDNFLLPVYMEIDNKGNFPSGSFVEIYLKTFSDNNALTVPNKALLEDQGVFYIYVQNTPELFEKREVKIGTTDGLRTEILQGLSKGERVVTKGAIFIKLAQTTGTLDAHSGHVH